ncbi:hypothetical protein CPC16_004500, partial [Podila verticillata]
MVMAGLRACQRLLEQFLDSVMHLPMSFFDTSPLGRIVNRFPSDLFACDDAIPCAFNVDHDLCRFRDGNGDRDCDFDAVVPGAGPAAQYAAGVSTIRAMAAGERFVAENAAKTDVSTAAYFTYITSKRWLQIRLEALGAVIVLGAALFAVLSRETLSPSMVTEDVNWMVQSFCDLQNSLVSVERIHEYVQKNPEAPSAMVADVTLPEKWPSEGRVEFRNYSTRYRQGLDLVIKSISFEVQPAEKVGIVGRTGADKSSLTLALFRIVKAANSHWARASHNGEDMDADLTKTRQQQQKEDMVNLEK